MCQQRTINHHLTPSHLFVLCCTDIKGRTSASSVGLSSSSDLSRQLHPSIHPSTCPQHNIHQQHLITPHATSLFSYIRLLVSGLRVSKLLRERRKDGSTGRNSLALSTTWPLPAQSLELIHHFASTRITRSGTISASPVGMHYPILDHSPDTPLHHRHTPDARLTICTETLQRKEPLAGQSILKLKTNQTHHFQSLFASGKPRQEWRIRVPIPSP